MRRRRAPRRSIAPDPFSYLARPPKQSDFLAFAFQLEDNESPMTVENARTRARSPAAFSHTRVLCGGGVAFNTNPHSNPPHVPRSKEKE